MEGTREPLLKNPAANRYILVIIFIILALMILTLLLVFDQTQKTILESDRQESMSHATAAAGLINGNLLKSIRPGDETTPAYQTVLEELALIRQTNPGIADIYTVRMNGSRPEYAVALDYRNPRAPAAGAPIGEALPALTAAMSLGFSTHAAEPDITTTAEGTRLFAYAPVRDSNGAAVGMVAVGISGEAIAAQRAGMRLMYLLAIVLTLLLAGGMALVVARSNRNALSALKENEDYLKAVVQSLQIGVLILDAKTHTILDANELALSLIGRPKDVVVGQVCHKFVCPAEVGKCPITDLHQTVDNSERVLINAKGEKVPIIKSVKAVTVNGRDLLIETYIDITERKAMEDYLKTMMDSLQIGILVLDAKIHTILDANTMALSLIGRPRDEVIGQVCHKFVCPTDYGKCPITDLHQTVDNSERVLINAKGEKVPILKSVKALTLNGKDLLIETFVDITERKAMEDYFKTMMESLQTGVLVLDAKTHAIRDANTMALSLIGRPRDEVIGQVCHKFVCPAEVGKCPITDLHQTVDNSERVLINAKGEKVPIIKSVKALTLNGKDLLLETFIDITERKKMEERNARLIRELEAANNELNDFAHIVSHDLKAPLRAIGSLSQWLNSDYSDKLDAEGKSHLDLLVNRVNRMQNLIEGILEYSRVGRSREEKEMVDINGLVKEVVDSLSPPPTIRIVVDTALPTILFEKTRLRQIFSNLIGNAIKYMDKQNGEIHIGCTYEENVWKFYVRDNGPGIEEKYYDRIFQIFQTLHSRDQVESTGIGLTIVKKIVELYRGRIWVESKVPEGSIFYFTIPITNTTDGGNP